MYKQLLTMADDMMAKGMLGRAAELYRYGSPESARKAVNRYMHVDRKHTR